MLSTSIGTSGVVFVHSDTPQVDPQGRLHTFCHAVRGKWHMMGVTLAAGGSLQWFRNALCETVAALAKRRKIDVYDVLTEEAAVTPPGAEGLFFLPYLAGERTPHADPLARGAFIGLTLGTRADTWCGRFWKASPIRSAIAWRSSKSNASRVKQIRATGGGAKSPFWRQMQADVLGKTVVSMAADEGPGIRRRLVGRGRRRRVQKHCRSLRRDREDNRPG